ncbi:orotidine-5'-phosphate decarboxylase [Brooklawnia cerclae]|uniref:Orotidine-5'-phosphate decarboxylase n=1 Tax=Brooklawnia cerclae TaxID=349934 RepID=A0ABX0SIS9_9ACTN|nr:orotidine-5'-phosphate decarboxylase [Brooklawnia cerclae]NIH56546.1 orotidine-5'-phosphate decarboxylase [Brooklawnia cerclae]
MSLPYRRRLAELVAGRGRICVGVDPHENLVRAWGYDFDADGVERVARTLVDVLGPEVPVFKPQAAFFECHGPAGMAALGRVLGDIAQAGALSLLDVKRGDIGSTMSAYARAYLSDDAVLAADAITVSPYLGFGSLAPAIELAHQTGRGIYVLCRTSNPEGAGLQSAREESGRSVAQAVVDAARETNEASGQDAVGLVIGATLETLDLDLDGFAGSILAPGIGSQGGSVAQLGRLFGRAAEHVLPSASRQVMKAGPDANALRTALDMLKGVPTGA